MDRMTNIKKRKKSQIGRKWLGAANFVSKSRTLMTVLMLCLTAERTTRAYVTTCASGEYLMLNEDNLAAMEGFCATCPRGYKCPYRNPPYTSAIKCAVGEYSVFKQTECTKCPAGWYCPDPEQLPIPCPKGEYSDEGQSECQPCTAGAYCDGTGQQTPCSAGELCQSYMRATPCPAGSKCPTPAAAVACDPGEYSLEGSTDCTKCPQGSYCPATDHVPIECADGYYQHEEGKQTCLQCDAGKQCPDKDKKPQSCPTGQYSSLAGSMQCHDCPAGVSCNGSTLTACPKGQYSEAGMSNCLDCPAGYECGDRKSKTECSAASGEFSRVGETYCQPCEPGFYCPEPYMEPRKCALGYYSAAQATSCTECEAGYSCEDPADVPRLCVEGTTSDAGSTFCVGCPAGATCTGGVATFCATGTIPQQDGKACVDCPAGMACPTSAWDKQVPCPPGYYSIAGMAHCQISPAGYYAPKTTEKPISCEVGYPDGYYYSDVGQTYCVQCPPGHQCKDRSGRHNTMCPPGSFYNGDGTCQSCAAGTSCPIAIGGYRDAGYECIDGTYAGPGSFDCELCKPGHDCNAGNKETTGPKCDQDGGQLCLGGKRYAESCPAGHECPFTETVSRCPLYFYSNVNNGKCEPCPDGHDCWDFSIQKSNGSSDPSEDGAYMAANNNIYFECQPGYYSRPLDFVCKPCPKGHYCPNAGTDVPIPCEGGTYADEGLDSCDSCPTDYYSLVGSEYCSPVPAGYRINDANDGLTICAHGTYSKWGETTCSTCIDGFLCPEGDTMGDDWHNSCPRGSYCEAGVQYKCPAGTYGIMERGVELTKTCEDCPPGYNCQPGTADFQLVPCPRGGYCEKGMPVQACPAGTYNDDLYGKSIADCKTCPIGQTCSSEQQDKGSVCAEGYYCPRGAGSKTYPCPAGTHGNSQTGKRDMNECLPCPPGHYCPEGSAAPTPAPAGKFTPLSGMPSEDALYKCPPKHYCPHTGMATYKGYFCEAGYVCPAGSTTGTEVECPAGTFSDRRDLHDTKHCDLCPKGWHCDTHSTSDNGRIQECPQHRYCPDGTRTSSIPLCPPGTYAPYTKAKSLNDCIECPAGMYCDGSVDNTDTAVGPQTCEQGHYCEPGTSFPDQHPCAPGYYNDNTGSKSVNDCKHCGFNKYCPGYGEISATTCPDGTHSSETTTAKRCTPCPAGYKCTHHVTFLYPEPCPAGQYSSKGSLDCTYCPVGTYCPNQATTDTDLKNQLCPAGTFCSRVQNYNHPDYGLGDYDVGLDVYPNKKDGADGHACSLYKYCPKGTTKELDIPRGTMQELWARGSLYEVIQMPAGNYSMPNLDTDGITYLDPPYITTECPAGHYCPDGAYEPVPCPTGYFRANILGKDQDSCGKCPAGTYCDTVGTFAPKICPAGHFCPEGANQAQACPRGTYYGGTGLYDSRGCTACESGHYCPFMGQISYDKVNNMCDAGFYCIAGSSRPEPTDLTTGSRCPGGGYCVKGTPAPAACSPGQYGPYKGARSLADCIDCKPGFYCLGEDSTDATSLCAAGYYCYGGTIDYNIDLVNVSDPDHSHVIDGNNYYKAGIASPGYYAPEGVAAQIKCPAGYFNEDYGRSECDSCPAGHFCDALGLDYKPKCQKGFYCESYESFVTAANALDVSDPMYGIVDYRQKPCPVGTWAVNSVDDGLSNVGQCEPCPATFACERLALTNDDTLPLCAAGYFCKSGAISRYPDQNGSTSGPCPAGYYCEEGTEDPEPCPIGTWSNQERATSEDYCMPCPPGYKCPNTGHTEPYANCDAGTYCEDGINQIGCTVQNGILGMYCPLGSQFELFCPMGFYQSAPNQGRCIDCPSGNFCMDGQVTTCDYGFYCP